MQNFSHANRAMMNPTTMNLALQEAMMVDSTTSDSVTFAWGPMMMKPEWMLELDHSLHSQMQRPTKSQPKVVVVFDFAIN